MISDASLSTAGYEIDSPALRRWERGLLWIGVPLCVAGLIPSRLVAQWREERLGVPIVRWLVSFAVSIRVRAMARRQRIEGHVEWRHIPAGVGR
jgi:hypothetical protein